MDAIIMEGQNLKAGSVAGVKNIRNPIDLARMVMDKVDIYQTMHSSIIRKHNETVQDKSQLRHLKALLQQHHFR